MQAPPEVIAAYTAVMAEKQAGKDATADAGVAGDATASGLPDGLKVRGAKRSDADVVFDQLLSVSASKLPCRQSAMSRGTHSKEDGVPAVLCMLRATLCVT